MLSGSKSNKYSDALCSKDDTYKPSFIPVQCPICFDCIWEEHDVVECLSCSKVLCTTCCDGMKATPALVYKSREDRKKYISCPFCRKKRFSLVHDIEQGVSPDQIRLVPRRPERSRHQPRTQIVVSACFMRTLFVATIVGFLYLMLHSR